MLWQKARILANPGTRYVDEGDTAVLAGLEIWVRSEAPREGLHRSAVTGRASWNRSYVFHPDSARQVRDRLGLDRAPHGIDQEAVELLPEFREGPE